MPINEFFDPYNYEHLQAYKHLSEYGVWPEGFIPENTTFPSLWNILLLAKMADAWVIHNEECFKARDAEAREVLNQ